MLSIYWLSRSCQGQPAAVADWPCWRRGWFAAWISCAALSAPPGPASLESSSPQTSPWCPCGTPCSLCHKQHMLWGYLHLYAGLPCHLLTADFSSFQLCSTIIVLQKGKEELVFYASQPWWFYQEIVLQTSAVIYCICYDDCIIISIINVLLVSCYYNNCCNFDLTVTFNSFCDCRKTFAFHK